MRNAFGIPCLSDMRRPMVLAVVLLGLTLLWAAPGHGAAKPKKTSLKKATTIKTRNLKPEQKAIPDCVAFKPELEKFIGTPYRFGGVGLAGIDCSGFAKTLFAEAFGIELPHNSRAISHLDFLQDLPSDWDIYRPSDLLFFGNGKGRINHMGIYLGEGKFIHASRTFGVIVSNLENSYWKRRLVSSKRVTVLDDTLLMNPSDTTGTLSALNMPSTLALGYRQPILDEYLDLGLEGFYRDQEHQDRPPARPSLSTLRRRWQAPSPIDHYEGWRARLSFTPSDWLRITPSLGNFEVADQLGESTGSLRTYGITTHIAPETSPWSLSMAAQTSYFRESADTLQDGDRSSWQSIDLAVDIGYRLAEGFNLSVSGSYSDLYEREGTAELGDLPANLNDVSLRLKIDF